MQLALNITHRAHAATETKSTEPGKQQSKLATPAKGDSAPAPLAPKVKRAVKPLPKEATAQTEAAASRETKTEAAPKSPKAQKSPSPPKAVKQQKSATPPKSQLKAFKPSKTAKADKADKAPKIPKPAKPVRDSFTLPANEYALIGELKTRLFALGHPAKKSELLRAGFRVLASLPVDELMAAVNALPEVKVGRKKK
jgi:hypothetical protein